MTNRATLWYVPLSLKNVDKVLEVPPIQVTTYTLAQNPHTQKNFACIFRDLEQGVFYFGVLTFVFFFK